MFDTFIKAAYPDLVRPGEIVRCDANGENFASADIARIRLLAVIAADREAVPAFRWVWKGWTAYNKTPRCRYLLAKRRIRWERRP